VQDFSHQQWQIVTNRKYRRATWENVGGCAVLMHLRQGIMIQILSSSDLKSKSKKKAVETP